MLVTRRIRAAMHAIDKEIWKLENLLSGDDPEHERVTLPLARKRRRRTIGPRRALEVRQGDPFWTEQAKRVIRLALDALLGERQLLYRLLRAEYRRNGGARRSMPEADHVRMSRSKAHVHSR
jgi:hypothetical protein